MMNSKKTISTVKKSREYLSKELRIPLDSLKIQANGKDVAGNKTLQELLAGCFIKADFPSFVGLITLSRLKRLIERKCHFDRRFIHFYRPNHVTEYHGNTRLRTLRKEWRKA